MTSAVTRRCPICSGEAGTERFPFRTAYDGSLFHYLGCRNCATVFVDPIPRESTFAKMYAKSAYHDVHYGATDATDYRAAVGLMSKHVAGGSSVLDYGCGAGGFLAACAESGFRPFGVDFDESAARSAGESVGCRWSSVADFDARQAEAPFDVIHLGDVIEHLPDPLQTLSSLLGKLRPGGFLFIEGPLEVNPSPVYWSARAFGAIRRIVKPRFVASHPPTHLLRTDAPSQLKFFSRLGKNFNVVEWRVYETGWPYSGNGRMKTAIGQLACQLGGKKVAGIQFGNRFQAMLCHAEPNLDHGEVLPS